MPTAPRVPGRDFARHRLIHASLRALAADYADPPPWADAEAESADDDLAIAARDLTAVVDALPADQQPIGWQPTTPAPVRDLLADVRSVFADTERGLPWTEIAARLADRLPDHYTGI